MRYPPQFEKQDAPKPVAPKPTTTPKLTKAQYDALKQYSEKHGHYWKHKLREDWQSGKCEAELQQVRNLGARWLKEFKFIKYVGIDWDRM